MEIKDHKITGIPFETARWMGGTITPEIVVVHDTASRLTPGNAARYLQNNDRNVSVHFVIECDGSVVQQVPLNRKANHAGKSHYHGRDFCNGFSIGIEIVNPGKMQGHSGWGARAWFGEVFELEEHDIQEVTTKEHGHGFWMPYTEAQIDTVIDLLQVLFNGIETLKDIVPHWYVSPGRKTDTNPLFPLEQVKSIIFGREDPVVEEADEQASHITAGACLQIKVPNGSLNMRRWPSFNPNIIASIPNDTVVPEIKRGNFGGLDWSKVFFDGRDGWIVTAYTESVKTLTSRLVSPPMPLR